MRKQFSFSRLWRGEDGVMHASDAAAKAARDLRYRELRKTGATCKRWVLRNQLRPYVGLGQPDGSVCDVYMLDVEAPEAPVELGR